MMSYNNGDTRRTINTWGSASSSSSSPPPPRPPPPPMIMMRRRSMEEVWGEIRPLPQLQEAHGRRRTGTGTGAGSQQRNPTALTLGSGQSDGYCNGTGTGTADGDADAVPVFTNSCFDNYALCGPHGNGAPPAGPASYCAKRRALEQQLDEGLGLDHRKKRLIKNRESAARSRARKQAYTNELEQEVAHLLDENSRLRRQYEELRLVMATHAPTKRTLHRASSAPI